MENTTLLIDFLFRQIFIVVLFASKGFSGTGNQKLHYKHTLYVKMMNIGGIFMEWRRIMFHYLI